MLPRSITNQRSEILRPGIGYHIKRSANGVSLIIPKPKPSSTSSDIFPFQASSRLDDETWKIKMRHGYLNGSVPQFNSATWVDNTTEVSVSNTTVYLVVQFVYNFVTRATSSRNVLAVASVTDPVLSGDQYTCQIPICQLTWDEDTLTSITQMRYGNIEAQIWGTSLSFWIA